MKIRIAAIALGSLCLSAPAQAAITVVTGSFIAAPTAFNGFENLPGHFTVPYDEQGIDVRYVTDETYNIFSTVQAYEGTQSFYEFGVGADGSAHQGHGYTAITLQSGADFPAIQFAVGSGYFDSGAALNYQLLNDGAVVQTGVAGLAPAYHNGFAIYGFYGAPFDEVRLQVNFDGAFDANAFDAGDFDAITVGLIPEPNAWALLIAGFGLTGAALRRRRTIPAVQAAI